MSDDSGVQWWQTQGMEEQMIACAYCGNEANEQKQLTGCCGEVHFEEIPPCPECGETHNVIRSHHNATFAVPECDYWYCEECNHQWGHE